VLTTSKLLRIYPTSDSSLDLLFLFYQEKRKSLSAAVSRGKAEQRQGRAKGKNSERIKIPACAGMTIALYSECHKNILLTTKKHQEHRALSA